MFLIVEIDVSTIGHFPSGSILANISNIGHFWGFSILQFYYITPMPRHLYKGQYFLYLPEVTPVQRLS
jgi:hypothetical protein